MESIALKPRTAVEIVDAAFQVYRRAPLQFILLTSVVHVPWLLVQILVVGGGSGTREVAISIVIGIGTLLTYFLMSGLIVHLASEVYLGRQSDAFDTFRRVGHRMPAVFAASIVQSIAIFLAALLFLFPAIYVTAILFAVVPVIVLENQSVDAALSRSKALSRDIKGRILATLGLVMIIRIIVQVSVTILVTLVITNPSLRYLVGTVASIILYPIIGISEALLYYDARIRKEGFDLEVMARRGDVPVAS